MEGARAYSTRQFVLAVCVAALLGWAAFALPATFAYWQQWRDLDGILPRTMNYLGLTAIVGLPIALVACWVVAAPILWRVMRRGVSWRLAVLWGIVVPGVMA